MGKISFERAFLVSYFTTIDCNMIIQGPLNPNWHDL